MDAMYSFGSPTAILTQLDITAEIQAASNCLDPEERVNWLLSAAEKISDHYAAVDTRQGALMFQELLPDVLNTTLREIFDRGIQQQIISSLVNLGSNLGVGRNTIHDAAREIAKQPTLPPPDRFTPPPGADQSLALRPPAAPMPVRTAMPVPAQSTAIAPNTVGALASQTIDLGQSIEEVFAQYGHAGVRYLPHELAENPRFYRLMFSWKAGDSPDKLKKRRYELALVGLDPEEIRIVIAQGVRTENGPEGRLEIHIPKSTWNPSLLLPWLYDHLNGPSQLRGRTERLQWLVYQSPKVMPGEPLTTVLGLDLQNNPIALEHKKGVFSVGSPDSGKSAALRARLVQALLRHTPETLQVYAIDLKLVTFAPFDGLIHLVADGAKVLDFFKALLEENKRRNQQFAQAGVTDILQYNSKYPGSPMPFLWVIWDEPNHTRRESKDATEVSKMAEELSGLTRSTGIYYDISTQYPTKEYALTPATRNNLSEKVLFQCSEAAADLVLETNGTTELASALLGDGDALTKVASCRRKITRVQSFFVPDDPKNNYLAEVVRELKDAVLQGHRPALPPSNLLGDALSINSSNSSSNNYAPTAEDDPWAAPSNGAVLNLLERAKWELIRKVERYNEQNPTRKISNRRLYAAVAGDRFLSEEQQRSYQIESLQDLIDQPQLPDSDPRTRIYLNGGNEQTARRYIEELRAKFAPRLEVVP